MSDVTAFTGAQGRLYFWTVAVIFHRGGITIGVVVDVTVGRNPGEA
ncbi:hypothetical protein [uncultured Veillonella sp.]|nr:hypothetical protein [uncultured Veillonella sp.]